MKLIIGSRNQRIRRIVTEKIHFFYNIQQNNQKKWKKLQKST